MPPTHSGMMVGTIKLPDIHYINTSYRVCGADCHLAFQRQHARMAHWLQSHPTEKEEFHSLVHDISAKLGINQHDGAAATAVNAVHIGETTAPIRSLGRDWAGRPTNSCMIGRRKLLHTVIPHAWMRSRTPTELYQDSGIVHRRCNNIPFGTLQEPTYKPLHPVQLTAYSKALTWRPIRDRLPLYLGYGIPTVCVYSPSLDTVFYGTYPDIRHGMDRSQVAAAEGRDNTQLTGLKPKCVPMLLQNLHDGTVMVIDLTDIPNLRNIINAARLKTMWEQCASSYRQHNRDMQRSDRPEDDPCRNLIASIRSMCLAAVSCNLAYFISAYASADTPIAIHVPDRSYVQHPDSHLPAGPGATGDPATRPDLPIGHATIERGYIVGIGDTSDSLKWAICERVGFGQRPIRVRLLADPDQTEYVTMADVKYVQRDVPSDYAQCHVTSHSDSNGDTMTPLPSEYDYVTSSLNSAVLGSQDELWRSQYWLAGLC